MANFSRVMRGIGRHALLRGPIAGLLACILCLSAALAGAHDHGLCGRSLPGPQLDVARAGADAPTSCPACKISSERVRGLEPARELELDAPPARTPTQPASVSRLAPV